MRSLREKIEYLLEVPDELDEGATLQHRLKRAIRTVKARASLAGDVFKRTVGKDRQRYRDFSALTGVAHHKTPPEGTARIHRQDEPEAEQDRRKAAIKAKSQIKRAARRGQRVVNRPEGRGDKPEGRGDRAFNLFAKQTAKKQGAEYKQKSLETPKTDPENKQSTLYKTLSREPQGKKAIAATLGSGSGEDKEAYPEDYPEKGVSARQARKGKGWKETVFGSIQKRLNKMRRSGWRKNLATDRSRGDVTIGIAGKGHWTPPIQKKVGEMREKIKRVKLFLEKEEAVDRPDSSSHRSPKTQRIIRNIEGGSKLVKGRWVRDPKARRQEDPGPPEQQKPF